MRVKDLTMLFFLAALWGGSFIFIRIGAPALGPLVLIELRVLIAAISLVIFAWVSRHRIRILHMWWQYLILGAANAALPFTFISFAELHLDAGFAAIINATTPMFTVLVSWLWAKEPLTIRKVAGVIIGLVGVGILVGWSTGAMNAHLWLAASFSIIAALLYGIAGVFSSKYFKNEKSMDMAIGQQLGATLVLLPFSLFALPSERPSGVVILSVLGLAVFCTAVAYLFFFALIKNVGPLKTLAVTFLVPVFGVIWGGLFLHEAITPHLVISLLIILFSVGLVANVRFKKPRKTITTSP